MHTRCRRLCSARFFTDDRRGGAGEPEVMLAQLDISEASLPKRKGSILGLVTTLCYSKDVPIILDSFLCFVY